MLLGVLSPASVVGPGHELLPSFLPGFYAWPGVVEGITFDPGGAQQKAVAAAQSLPVVVAQASAAPSSLTPNTSAQAVIAPDTPGTSLLGANVVEALPLPPDG